MPTLTRQIGAAIASRRGLPAEQVQTEATQRSEALLAGLRSLPRASSASAAKFESGSDPAAPKSNGVQLAAIGDLKCSGGSCRSGGSYGTTGMYSIGGRTLCHSCAVKELGLGGLPVAVQIDILRPFLLGR